LISIRATPLTGVASPRAKNQRINIEVAAVKLEPARDCAEKTRGILDSVDPGGAESGALSAVPLSPALSLLLKLTAGLTADERAALAQLLAQSEGG
jgi:hypothetical protein